MSAGRVTRVPHPWVPCPQLLKVKKDPHLGARFLANVVQFETPTEAEVKSFADAGIRLLAFDALLATVRT